MEVSEDVIQFLRDQAWAQVESNRLLAEKLALERATLEIKQRELDLIDKDLELKRVAENRRDARLAEVLARYANQGEQVAGLVKTGWPIDSIMREGFEAFSDEVRVIKRGLYALLSRDGGDIQKVKLELRSEFDQEETQKLIIKQRRNLAKLREREAKSAGQAPVELLNQIEDVQAEIDRLSGQLAP